MTRNRQEGDCRRRERDARSGDLTRQTVSHNAPEQFRENGLSGRMIYLNGAWARTPHAKKGRMSYLGQPGRKTISRWRRLLDSIFPHV